MKLEKIPTYDDMVSSICELLDNAEEEVLIGISTEMYEQIADNLERCYNSGTFIALCLYTDEATAAQYDFDNTATLVRAWDEQLDTLLSADQQRGVVGMPWKGDEGVTGLAFDTEMLYGMAFLQFMSQQWDEGDEVYVTPSPTLPYDCSNLRDAALTTTLHLREGNTIGFEAEVRPAPANENDPWDSLEGQLATVRQSFVDPSTNTFFGEIGLIGYSDGEGRVTMGGHGAYAEDYEAQNIHLTPL